MNATIEVFVSYDMSAWHDRGLIIASAVRPSTTKKPEKRSGLRTVLALSFLAFGITQVQPQIPLTQATVSWARSSIAQSNRINTAEYVPADYWTGLITEIRKWPQATDVTLPDFDSLSS